MVRSTLIDIMIILIILIPMSIIIWFYFSSSKKEQEPNPVQPTEENLVGTSNLICSQQITVVFQKDLANDEELVKEIADMYISKRAYYYSGNISETDPILKEKDVFVKYDNIDFSVLMPIDI